MAQVASCLVYGKPPKNMQHMPPGNIQYVFHNLFIYFY